MENKETIEEIKKEETTSEESIKKEVTAEKKAEEFKEEATKVNDEKQPEEQVEDNEEISEKPKKKIMAIVISIIILLILIVGIYYWRTAVYYQTHFLPNTSINDIDCSELEAEQVATMLDSKIQEYNLVVTGRLNEEGENGTLGEIGAEDINLQYVGTLEAVEHLLEFQNEWLWIAKFSNKHYSRVLLQGVSFDEEMLEAYVKKWDAFRNMKKPQNAYISEYSEDIGGYEIIPETIGTQFDVEMAIDLISNTITMQAENRIDLEAADCYVKPSVTADDKDLNESVDKVNKWLETEIAYDWNAREVIVDREVIREWISFEKGKPQLDEEAVAEFVTAQANEYDTYGKYRRFMTTLGVELNLPSGYYGWKTDTEGETKELLALIYEGSTEEREPLYTSKGRWKGINDIGNSYVEADLTNQHLYLYYQGNLVLETDFVSGAPYMPGCMTPAGVFGISYKTTNAVLRGQDYETPVSYWMPFYGNFGMHDATWRTEFGRDIYLTDGSHGCLNLPLDKAEAIYGYMSEGFPVICYYY